MTLNIIVSERETPLPPASPWPLIYELDFDDEDFEKGGAYHNSQCEKGVIYQDMILQAVAEDRAAELECEDVEGIKAGLELHFAYIGSPDILMDWRCA